MTDKYNDLKNDLRNMPQAPPPWLTALRESEIDGLAHNLITALNAVGDAAAHCLADLSRNFETLRRTYVSSYEGRRLRRALRALGLIASTPAPVSRYKAHGRRRSRRERRDIRHTMRRRR